MSKYTNPMFVSTNTDVHFKKTASKFIAYRTLRDGIYLAEPVDNGNAFFIWQYGKKDTGHKDTHINYLTPTGENWQATLKDYVFTLYPNGDRTKGQTADRINYISGDNLAYEARFAEQSEVERNS